MVGRKRCEARGCPASASQTGGGRGATHIAVRPPREPRRKDPASERDQDEDDERPLVVRHQEVREEAAMLRHRRDSRRRRLGGRLVDDVPLGGGETNERRRASSAGCSAGPAVQAGAPYHDDWLVQAPEASPEHVRQRVVVRPPVAQDVHRDPPPRVSHREGDGPLLELRLQRALRLGRETRGAEPRVLVLLLLAASVGAVGVLLGGCVRVF